MQGLILDTVVLDSIASLALQALLKLKTEGILRICPCLFLLLVEEELLKQVREVLPCVLLLPCLELLVPLSNQRLEDRRSNSILIELILLLLLLFCRCLLRLPTNVYLLCQFLL